MEITAKAVAEANQRGRARQAAMPVVERVRYDRRIGRVVVAFAGGLEIAFAPRHAQGLEHARPADLEHIEISPSGLGVHFPSLDADIHLPSLLEGLLGSRRWMAAENGRIGASTMTQAKPDAARRNGKLGGRPRKKTAATIA